MYALIKKGRLRSAPLRLRNTARFCHFTVIYSYYYPIHCTVPKLPLSRKFSQFDIQYVDAFLIVFQFSKNARYPPNICVKHSRYSWVFFNAFSLLSSRILGKTFLLKNLKKSTTNINCKVRVIECQGQSV